MTLHHNEREAETSDSALVTYFRDRDGVDPGRALDRLAFEVSYHLMPKPGAELSGTGRERLRATLAGMTGRPGLHRVIAECVTGDVQFVLGHRVEDGEPVGTFLAAATTSESGEIAQYVGAYFDSMNLGGTEVTGGGAEPAGQEEVGE